MKRLLKVLWESTWPLRRPFQRRAEAFLTRCLSQAMEKKDPARARADEVTLVLDAVLTEQFRLQEQIEEIHRLLADAAAGSDQKGRYSSSSRVVAHSGSEITRPEILSRENSER
jgi:hypothetical protein